MVPRKIIDDFESPTEYLKFLEDYEEAKEIIDILKHELASLE